MGVRVCCCGCRVLIFWTKSDHTTIKAELTKFAGVEYEIRRSGNIPHIDDGDILVCMGGKNLLKVQQEGHLPKARTITSMRHKLHKINGNPLFVTFDADIGSFDHVNAVMMQIDIGLVYRFVTTGSVEPELGEYKYVEDYDHLPEIINANYNQTGRPVRTALDLETYGLDPFNSEKWIVSISITIEEGQAEVIRFEGLDVQPDEYLLDQINWLMNDDRVSLIGANLKYDLMWLWVKWGIQTSNFKVDTTLVGALMDENRSNSLNTHCKVYAPTLGGYDDTFNNTQNKANMHLVPEADLLPYAGGDTDATLRVANKLVKKLAQSASQTKFYTKLLHPASMAFLNMERTGVLVDQEKTAALQFKLFEEMKVHDLAAKALMPKRLLHKYGEGFSLTKATIIKDFMFTHGDGLQLTPQIKTKKTNEPSTAIDHLKMFEDVPEAKEFVAILKEWNSAKKTESTYVTGFMKHLREDGRLHPTANLYRGDYGNGDDSGTVTGRLSFKDPAFQTVPKHTKWAKALRECYPAPDGYCIVQWDFSQGELRVIACVANETTMIQAYKDGIDLHLKTGAELNGYTLAEAHAMKAAKDVKIKEIRQGGKAGNFGLIYGISPEGYVIYARDTYGVEISLEESQAQQTKFFGIYPRILDYHDEYMETAHVTGIVQSPLGRVRHLPLINSGNWGKQSQSERQAINAPIQSTLSDMSCLTLVEVDKKHGYNDDCKFFSMTHDSLAAYVKIDQVDFWVPEIQGIMENLPLDQFGWNPQLSFPVDAEIGYSMGTLSEMADYPDDLPSEVLERTV